VGGVRPNSPDGMEPAGSTKGGHVACLPVGALGTAEVRRYCDHIAFRHHGLELDPEPETFVQARERPPFGCPDSQVASVTP
jgi:hypothetical protein